MEYALLYTFSTIPQALAAALGVLAAFVLYRLQSDSDEQFQDAHNVVGATDGEQKTLIVQPPITLNALLGQRRYRDLLAELDRIFEPKGGLPRGSGQALSYTKLTTALDARDRILAALTVAFWATAAVILASVALLSFAQVLCRHTLGAVVILVIGVLAIAVCMGIYYHLIRAALWN